MPLVPIEVHRLADAIETRVRLRKIARKNGIGRSTTGLHA